MKYVSVGCGLLLVVSALACGDDSPSSGGQGVSAKCSVPWDCDPGYTCDSGTCVEFGCTPDSCAAGEFCDADYECKTIEEKCTLAEDGCECHILNAAGELDAGGQPQITMAPGATVGLHAVLAVKGGGQLPGAVFSWGIDEGDDGNQFSLSDAELTALAAGGEATVTASAGSHASCSAGVKNLGSAPADHNVRFFVYDDRTGAPVDGTAVTVEIVVDTDGDGVDDGWSTGRGTTDANGVATTTELQAGNTFDVTVFATGFNYLTVTNLSIDAAGKDIALPLSARPASSSEKTVGGFSGKMDFTDYENLVLGGTPKTIKFGIVSGSIPLRALLNFDLDLLIGDVPSASECEADSSTQGCYAIDLNIPGFDMVAPLPGGTVLSFAGNAIKPNFDVVAAPGRRYAWSLGGEIEIADLAGLLGMLACTCDTTNACDDACACDTDCGIDFGELFNNLAPLLSVFSSGVQGNLGLEAVNLGVWNDYLGSGSYGSRDDPNNYFPILDDGSLGKLSLREPLHSFTDFEAPPLPQDPDEDSGVKMEGMIVLSGVNAAGSGFVPLGIGAGLDCTEGNCLDRSGADGAGIFDGTVNGGLMCFYDPDPAYNGCPPGVPADALPNGHLGVFHAMPHGGLEGQERLTVAVALPISSLSSGSSSDIRATAFVLREAPTIGTSTQIKNETFPEFPQQPTSTNGRSYQVGNTDGIGLNWVTFATNDVDGISTRWNVYMPGSGGTFVAPTVPSGFNDPAAPAGAGGDITEGHVNATHVAFRLADNVTVADLAANNGSTLADVALNTDGFSIQSRDICALDSCP